MADKKRRQPAAPSAQPGISAQERAAILAEALPFMQRYSERTIVVKYGGHAMGDETVARDFARDIVLLKQSGVNPVVIHGGGPQIGAMLERLGIKSEFAAGLRVTDRKTVEVVEMVLAGGINKQLVSAMNSVGGRAIGLSGKDGNMVLARKVTRTVKDPDSNIERIVDLGFVGEPEEVNREVLDVVINSNLIPILAPVATSASGETYNVNADTFAGAIAGALRAERFLLLTDVPGVLDRDGKLIRELTVRDARKLIHDGVVSGGMIPKIETCISALYEGVGGVVILDGEVPHSVLLELYTEHGIGTLIRL
ncbi:MAG: acetylglutamate kinase [Hyphomicrobiales bacterium]|nr:acetylglutamate kinase [Hyphomicrobiales bacterium]